MHVVVVVVVVLMVVVAGSSGCAPPAPAAGREAALGACGTTQSRPAELRSGAASVAPPHVAPAPVADGPGRAPWLKASCCCCCCCSCCCCWQKPSQLLSSLRWLAVRRTAGAPALILLLVLLLRVVWAVDAKTLLAPRCWRLACAASPARKEGAECCGMRRDLARCGRRGRHC